MRVGKKYNLEDTGNFKKRLLYWSEKFNIRVLLDSNYLHQSDESPIIPTKYEFIAAMGVSSEILSDGNSSFNQLQAFFEEKKDWLFGFLSYDLKNEIENLHSELPDGISFPKLHFFCPQIIFILCGNVLEVLCDSSSRIVNNEHLIQSIIETDIPKNHSKINSELLKSRFSKKEYIETVYKIKEHIQYWDVYELNLCQEFYINDIKLSPVHIYDLLCKVSPTPFSCFYQFEEKYLMSASPERFLKKDGRKLYSQPIKGTISRSTDSLLDIVNKEKLLNDKKELSENVMIVDLVRNDLSRSSEKGSVEVEELFGIYSFPQVHQMISTVSSTLRDDLKFSEAIKNAFPMGSMTGAPKIKAMELIEKYEKTRRGLYSGAVGFVDPKGNFDFNVIIRSILYNLENQYLSYIVGGAITQGSIPGNEYEECLLKAKAMKESLFN